MCFLPIFIVLYLKQVFMSISKTKCKVINMSVYSVAAVFPEITGIAQHIFLHVQVLKKVTMRICDA